MSELAKAGAVRMYLEISKSVKKLDATALQLLVHPEATDEQILAMRDIVRNAHETLQEAEANLRKAGLWHRIERGWAYVR